MNSWMSQHFSKRTKLKKKSYLWKNEERLRVANGLDTKDLKVKDTVKNLGVLIDCDFSFDNHVKPVTESAFHHLKNIAKLRGLVQA